MAKLPNADRAIIPREKIVDYLLSLDHSDGWGKARFFMMFGFTAERWYDLKEALLRHARETDVAEEVASVFGRKYILIGRMAAPDGRAPSIRAVWMVAAGEEEPRFVTAFSEKEVKP